ncbi:outer membrane protein [Pararhizobium mangrovi]|uniref:Porin family protein n=1 Tax=Pararhizobium mangrovi TaxID=2590452 RepID=A0A506TVM3_9HYPH|nr:outer membrane protein [Pararhizobium mangrovi]TPW26132.1 porin family protein [Pararhizobium mangrovi]
MKKLVLFLSAGVAIAPAHAADFILPPAPPAQMVPPPLVTWGGFYAGGQIGGAFAGDDGSLRSRSTTERSGNNDNDDNDDQDDNDDGGDDNGDNGDNGGNNGNDNGGSADGGDIGAACGVTPNTAACSAIDDGFDTADQFGVAGAGTDNTGTGAVLADGTSGDGSQSGDGDDGANASDDDDRPATLQRRLTTFDDDGDGGNASIEERIDLANGFSNGFGDELVGGAHAGYNFQFGQFVIGPVASIDFLDADRSGSLGDGNSRITAHQSLDYVASARLNVGYAIDRLLIYGTGGLAFGDVKTRFDAPSFDSQEDTDTLVGYTVGGGASYLLTPHLSFGVEYRYTNLGDADFKGDFDLGDSRTLRSSVDDDVDFHTVMATVSYHFQ